MSQTENYFDYLHGFLKRENEFSRSTLSSISWSEKELGKAQNCFWINSLKIFILIILFLGLLTCILSILFPQEIIGVQTIILLPSILVFFLFIVWLFTRKRLMFFTWLILGFQSYVSSALIIENNFFNEIELSREYYHQETCRFIETSLINRDNKDDLMRLKIDLNYNRNIEKSAYDARKSIIAIASIFISLYLNYQYGYISFESWLQFLKGLPLVGFGATFISTLNNVFFALVEARKERASQRCLYLIEQTIMVLDQSRNEPKSNF